MPLPEKRDHKISLAEATALTRQHRQDHPKSGHAEFFHRLQASGFVSGNVVGVHGCLASVQCRGHKPSRAISASCR